jgi:hypothetical protein
MTAIVRIYRIGHPRQYQVRLACGHRLVVTDDELRQRQLFLGKRIVCPECKEVA